VGEAWKEENGDSCTQDNGCRNESRIDETWHQADMETNHEPFVCFRSARVDLWLESLLDHVQLHNP